MENQGLPRALVMGIAGLIFIVLFGSSMFFYGADYKNLCP